MGLLWASRNEDKLVTIIIFINLLYLLILSLGTIWENKLGDFGDFGMMTMISSLG